MYLSAGQEENQRHFPGDRDLCAGDRALPHRGDSARGEAEGDLIR